MTLKNNKTITICFQHFGIPETEGKGGGDFGGQKNISQGTILEPKKKENALQSNNGKRNRWEKKKNRRNNAR